MKKEEDQTNGGFKVIQEKKNSNKIYKTLMLVVLVAFMTFIATSIGMYKYLSANMGTSMNLSALVSKETTSDAITNKINEYRKIIDKYYLGEIDENKLKEGAIKGYIEGLDDQYTEYIPKEDMEEYTEDIEGEFVGIGVYMIQDKEIDRVRVLAPIKNGPAAEAGIQSGDIIRSLNDVEYTASQMSELSQAIKGEEGSTVKLEIIRGEEIITYTLKRSNVKLNPVEGEIIEDEIGYIEFSSFDKNTANEFRKKYEELKEQGIKSLIIDIRNNGGGIVQEAVSIAGTILDNGSTVLYEINKNNEEEEMKTNTDPIIDVPIVLLVNENSASASEILAGALRDYEKAKIVGKTTYGKGVIQQLLSLPDGSGLKITSEEYLTPKKNKINKVGIEPDESVDLPKDIANIINVEKEKDKQLQKAIELLKK